jgi:hypothetical protein
VPPRGSQPIAMLWDLAWNGDRVSCAVYKARRGLEMRLESGSKTIFIEPFQIQPRSLARAQALKRSLERRGWRSPSSD